MTRFCETDEFSTDSVGIVIIAVTSLFVSECDHLVYHGLLIVLLDRYLFVASTFSIGAHCPLV